jgi:MATE family multidrug resistance protein
MVVTFVGVLLNILGNWMLIWGVPGVVRPMGVVGSGAATSLVRWCMFAAMAAYVFRRAGLRAGRPVARRPEWTRLGRIARLGGPIAAQYGAEVGVFATAAVMMGWLGRAQIAAHQVTISIASTTFMVALGVGFAGGIRVGQHVGARDLRGVHRATAATYLLVLAFMGACALAFLAAPRFLVGLYTHDPTVMELGTTLLFLAAAFQLFDGGQVAGVMVLRGAADTRVPMLITILGYWVVGFPVAWFLGFRTSLAHAGIWTGLVVALGVVALLLAWRVRRVVWGARPLVPVARDGVDEGELAATAV